MDAENTSETADNDAAKDVANNAEMQESSQNVTTNTTDKSEEGLEDTEMATVTDKHVVNE